MSYIYTLPVDHRISHVMEDYSARDFVSATAKNMEEAQKPVESGFEYVCEFEGSRLFRKRK